MFKPEDLSGRGYLKTPTYGRGYRNKSEDRVCENISWIHLAHNSDHWLLFETVCVTHRRRRHFCVDVQISTTPNMSNTAQSQNLAPPPRV
jgi:hypothetical protein